MGTRNLPMAPSPFQRASRVSIPGRGRVSSWLLALGTVLMILMVGVAVVLIYLESTEDAAREARDVYITGPMVDLSASP